MTIEDSYDDEIVETKKDLYSKVLGNSPIFTLPDPDEAYLFFTKRDELFELRKKHAKGNIREKAELWFENETDDSSSSPTEESKEEWLLWQKENEKSISFNDFIDLQEKKLRIQELTEKTEKTDEEETELKEFKIQDKLMERSRDEQYSTIEKITNSLTTLKNYCIQKKKDWGEYLDEIEFTIPFFSNDEKNDIEEDDKK